MNQRKILSVLCALAVMVSICLSVFAVAYVASADNQTTVRLVSMEYIEQTLLPSIEDKIQQGSTENMQETLAAINKTIDYLNGQVASNSGSIGALESDIATLKDALKDIEDEMSLVKDLADQGAISGVFEALKQRVEALEQTVSILNQDVSGLKESMNGVNASVGSLQESVQSLKQYAEAQIAALSGKVNVNAEGLAALNTASETMKNELATIKSEYTALSAAYNTLSQRYVTLENDNTTQRSELAQMKTTLGAMETKLSNMTQDYGELVEAYNDYTKTLAALKDAAGEGSASFAAIFLKEGETLNFTGLPSDTLELIVRRGDVTVVSPYPTQGVLDITDSVELLDGKAVPTYHYMMIVGGSDGRGVVSVTGDAWILVRGAYEIV